MSQQSGQAIVGQQSDGAGVAPRVVAANEIRRRIRNRVWLPGTPLPPQRLLADEIGVSQPTVRRALDLLEEEGLLTPQRGHLRLVAKSAEATAPSMFANCVLVLGPVRRGPDTHDGGTLPHISFGIQEELAAQGLHAFVLSPERLTGAELDHHLSLRPMGVAVPEFVGHPDPGLDLGDSLRRASVPVVAYGDQPAVRDFDRVVSDHAGGAARLTECLLAQGRRRILQLLPARAAGSYWVEARRQGYEKAMRAAGLEPLPVLFEPDFMLPVGSPAEEEQRVHERLLAGCLASGFLNDEPVDGILAVNDWEVPWVEGACRLLGRQVGTDVAIAGYDNAWPEVQARYPSASPPVATIDKHNFEAGRQMVRLLLARFRQELDARPVRRLSTPGLVTRETSD